VTGGWIVAFECASVYSVEFYRKDQKMDEKMLTFQNLWLGGYLGGDGGMESDYDDVIAPSDFYGLDQKVRVCC
jgi:hypothetical protein